MPKIRKVNHRFDRINSLTPVRNHSCVAMPNMRVIYAGSFDPIHTGHCMCLIIYASNSRMQRYTSSMCLPQPKPNMTDGRLRVAMIKQAIKNKPQVYLDMSQINRGKMSFLPDELSELRSRYVYEHTPLILAFSDEVINNLHLWGEHWKNCLIIVTCTYGSAKAYYHLILM